MKRLITSMFFIILLISCNDSTTDSNTTKPAEPDTTTHNIVWEIDTVGEFGTYPEAIWGSNYDDVYIVGTFYADTGGTQLARWDGTKWNILPLIPNFGNAHGIIGFSSDDIWIAGRSNGPALVHFNGVKWNLINVFSTYLNNELTAVWGMSSKELWAVGYNGLIVHYNGLKWTQINSGTTMMLYDVWGSSSSNVYFAGGNSSTGMGVLLHWNGKEMIKIFERTSTSVEPGGVVSTVYVLNDTLGYISSGSGEFWGKDSVWKKLYAAPFDNTYLEKIRGNSSKNIFFVGHFGLIVHWNGKSWHRYDQFFKKPGGDVLQSVWIKGDDVFITGFKGARGLVYRGKMLR